MTKDIAYDFDVGPGIDLSGRMTVSKSMRADYFGRDASQMRIVPDTMANAALVIRSYGIFFRRKTCLFDRAGGRFF